MKKQEKPDKETLNQWHEDPSNWRYGVLYYNKLDRRLFPPKRVKQFGWTINFANPFSYITVMGIILAVYVIARIIQ